MRGRAPLALLTGVGFTMAIFMAGLSFTSPAWLAAAKLGVLLGSTLAAVGGLLWGRFRVNTTTERLAVSSCPTGER
ncbi:Na+/H+ antiporter NhaA [Pseudomonas japonica]|nr:Na+/H+ antiporter NhaA [Pseudomonas japonica]MBA1288512.1 Na+/H+ antiporter NhaA [Pseudomonas japonica]